MPAPHAAAVNPEQTLDNPEQTLNNPEQIRTNLNTAERPDQIGTPPRSPPNTPKKNTPEHRCAPSASFLRRQEPGAAPAHQAPPPFPNSSLPPFRREATCAGGDGREGSLARGGASW